MEDDSTGDVDTVLNAVGTEKSGFRLCPSSATQWKVNQTGSGTVC